MFYLIYFTIGPKEHDLIYPLPQTFDIAVLDERLDLLVKKQIVLPVLDEPTDEALFKCWQVGIEATITFIAQTERRFLIFPTSNHLKLFHIIKQRCKLRTNSSGNENLENLTTEKFSDTRFLPEVLTVEEMILRTKEAGAKYPSVFQMMRDKPLKMPRECSVVIRIAIWGIPVLANFIKKAALACKISR